MNHPYGPETTIGQLCEAPELAPFAPFFFTKMTPDVWNRTLGEYGYEKCAFPETLDRLRELAAGTDPLVYSVYSQEEQAEGHEKAGVKVVHMPGPKNSPCVLVCPGGAYARQWGIIEGLAIGAELNRLGITAFILYYRTKQNPPFDVPLLPDPMEDLATAVAWMVTHAPELGADPSGYAVCGFSAGAHLAAEWGTDNLGWRRFGLPRPAALLLGYPAVNSKAFYDAYLTNGCRRDDPGGPYLFRMVGYDPTPEKLSVYDVDAHMDRDYPPAFVVACEDDPTVPISNSRLMESKLKELGIPSRVEIGKKGGHSFGVGKGTDVEGWLPRAVEFWSAHR